MNIIYIFLGVCLIYSGFKLLTTSAKRFESNDPNQHGIDYVAERWKGDPNLVKAQYAVRFTLFSVLMFVAGMLIVLYGLAKLVGIDLKLN